jgi:hypothetical protein
MLAPKFFHGFDDLRALKEKEQRADHPRLFDQITIYYTRPHRKEVAHHTTTTIRARFISAKLFYSLCNIMPIVDVTLLHKCNL